MPDLHRDHVADYAKATVQPAAGACGEHCPFLNRADRRCSKNFSLDQIQHAFEHCFGEYRACGVYDELLAERQVRRGNLPAGPWDVWPSAPRHAVASPARAAHASTSVVQLTIKIPSKVAHRYAKPAAAASYVPAAPRF